MTHSSPAVPTPWNSPGPKRLGVAQGLFYVLSGIWPILDSTSFMALSGPKTDVWLVKTVGGLLAITGVALTLAALRRRLTPEWALVAGGQAAVLATIDVVYVARDRIAAIYLADAAVELVLVVCWMLVALRTRHSPRFPT